MPYTGPIPLAFGLALAMSALGPLPAAALPVRSLDECVRVAVEQHPTLKVGGSSVTAAGERVYQAASGYLPQVNGVYAANRRNTNLGAQTGTGLNRVSETFNFYSSGVSFSQVLFDFGRRLNTIRAAQASRESAEADLARQRDLVVFNVKQAYFGVLATDQLVAVAREALRQSRQHLQLAEARHEVGFAPRFDITREQVQVASNELNLLSAENDADVARETLRTDMGLDGPLDFEPAAVPEPEVREVDEAAAVRLAHAHRPELLSLQARQRESEEEVQALRKDYLPWVSGNGLYQWTGNDYPLASNWNIGASVNLSLFNGGLTRAQVAEARADLAGLRHEEEALRQSIALEVRRALLDLRQAGRSIGVAATGLRQARENLELAEGRYKTGIGNVIEVTDAQAKLADAEARHIQTTYDYRNSMAALERAVARPVGPEDGILKKPSHP